MYLNPNGIDSLPLDGILGAHNVRNESSISVTIESDGISERPRKKRKKSGQADEDYRP